MSNKNHSLFKRIRNRIRFFNRHFLNKVTGRFAGTPHGIFAMLHHVGRKSGKHYQIPILLVAKPAAFLIALTYGTHVDWYHNLLANGICSIGWRGSLYRIGAITELEPKAALAQFPAFERVVLQWMGIRDFVCMQIAKEF